MGRFLIFSPLTLFLLLVQAGAESSINQTDPRVVVVVDTVEVVADRPEPLETLSTFATVHLVEASVGGVETVADVIEDGVGVHVRRYGGIGAYSTASIRASSPGQVEIYLDGVPLRSGQWGVVSLADLPLDGLERIEVYRSGAPIRFGTAGIGGLINLVSRSPGNGRLLGSVSAGSYDTWKIDLLRSGTIGEFGYVLSYHHLRSRGDYEYLDRHGTPENPDDDEVVTRSNNAFKQTDLLARVTIPSLSGWRVELAGDWFRKESGIPGIENVQTESVGYEVRRDIARVSAASPSLLDGGVDLTLGAFYQRRRDLFFNPENEVGFHRSDTDNTTRVYGGNALATFRWYAVRQMLSLFGEVRWERFVPKDENPAIGTGFTRTRRTETLSFEDRFVAPGDRLELLVGYRFQEAVDNFAGPEPIGGPPVPLDEPHRATFAGRSFGARLHLHPRVVLKANHTRYGRFPTMLELFGASGYVEGNSGLTPERGATTDAGITIRSADGSGFFEAVLFRAERENLVVFLQNSQRTVKAQNLESALVHGVELSARHVWESGLELAAGYTLGNARNTGPSPTYHGKRLPYEPEHDLFVKTALDLGWVELRHEYHYQSGAYRDRANLPENMSPPSSVHDVGAVIDVVPGLVSLNLEVRNVTDEQIVDVEGYPLPGRTFFVTLLVESVSNAE